METAYRFERVDLFGPKKVAVRVYRRLKTGAEKLEKYISFPDTREGASEARMVAYCGEILASEQKLAQYRAEQAAAKKAAQAAGVNPFKVGDVLYSSWGYEQTNVDFYQITRVSEKSVWYKKIQCTLAAGEGLSPMAGYVTAVKDSFVDGAEEFCRPVKFNVCGSNVVAGIAAGRYGVSLDRPGARHYCSWYA